MTKVGAKPPPPAAVAAAAAAPVSGPRIFLKHHPDSAIAVTAGADLLMQREGEGGEGVGDEVLE